MKKKKKKEEEGNSISEFQVSIQAANHDIGAWVCWFCYGFAWVCWFRCGFIDFVVSGFIDFVVSSMFFVVLAFVEWVPKSSLKDLISIRQKRSLMDSSLAFQNRVYYTRDGRFVNSFENVLTNEFVWKSMSFWQTNKKKKTSSRANCASIPVNQQTK